ncbi:insulinase family protein [Pseudodesulfovibrio senegalensis]|uniref:Peptidase M16 n=1 Tax=Pseudodesulfovibrio senegalensis TaxID=1721087 RepID=A0A6N6N2G8_9BACT|nr:insulinase family protein [Pseudodesulfovibrio senegalensis]KAB1441632.1 peptidase M16 [Pseudodesulfovibrio senegalensis]
MIHGFEKIRQQSIPELNSTAFVYRHAKTGGRVLSICNDDENKVFGISFRTPPEDSTGVAHILEHSVLCGSRKYPVKEPFVELLKGSLQTFLNAMTFPDKTCYPVASANTSDFYNLMDVYLDAVFYPNLTENTLRQEGWHYELEAPDKDMTYKGVVYNEMKGAYSSPDSLLYEHSQQSLFPDTTYGLDSGGDPATIPDLTWEKFSEFHRTHYHPSNAYAFFYGDDDPEKRLEKLGEYFDQFEPLDPSFSRVPLQPRFEEAVQVVKGYPASGKLAKGMFTVNWLLAPTNDANLNLALHVLEHILIGLPSSPLRKNLTESGLGEDLAGVGLEADMRQMFFSVGLKGMHPANAVKVESIIFHTIKDLVEKGIDPKDVDAAINSVEFGLRENNTGSYPRGLSLMFQSLSTWIYDEEDGTEGDPLRLLPFDEPLANIKRWVADGEKVFEELLARLFLHNPHRSTVLLKPEHKLGKEIEQKERARLDEAKKSMSPEQLDEVMELARELHRLQEAPDAPEDLARIPRLAVADLPRENQIVPTSETTVGTARCLHHDLTTNGIAYLDFGFDLTVLPDHLLPLAGLFGRMLTEMGTQDSDFVSMSQRIARTTGGIHSQVFISPVVNSDRAAARLFLRAKCTLEKGKETAAILTELLTRTKFNDRERFRQILFEAKSRAEQRLVPSGHMVVAMRLKARAHRAHAMEEAISGVTNLEYLRTLAQRVEKDFGGVLAELEQVRDLLLTRNGLVLNATMTDADFAVMEPLAASVASALPENPAEPMLFAAPELPLREGLTIPSQVNYVGKGCNVFAHGFEFSGPMLAASKFLRTSYLWEKVRVQGGAYGGFCTFDRTSGSFNFISYRDPNVEKTIEAYDGVAPFLKGLQIPEDELEKSVIGAVGELDAYMLPDAKGFSATARILAGETNEQRQTMRDQLLATKPEDFVALGEAAAMVAEHGAVTVLGNGPAMDVSNLDLEMREIW